MIYAEHWRRWVRNLEARRKGGLKAPTERVCKDPGPPLVRFLFGEDGTPPDRGILAKGETHGGTERPW